MTEQIASVFVGRDDARLYTVSVAFSDGTHREVTSAEWTSIHSALDFAAKLIAGELAKRDALAVVP